MVKVTKFCDFTILFGDMMALLNWETKNTLNNGLITVKLRNL